jgi:hypothetical protein
MFHRSIYQYLISTAHNGRKEKMLKIGLSHLLDGVTNLKYKLLCFSTPNKFFKEKGTSF